MREIALLPDNGSGPDRVRKVRWSASQTGFLAAPRTSEEARAAWPLIASNRTGGGR